MMAVCAAMILAAVGIRNPAYLPQRWHTFLLTSLLLVANSVLASLPTRFLGKLNKISASINFISLIVFCVTVPIADINTPKFNTESHVWREFRNGTEWPDGFAVLMSFLAVIFTISGFDVPFHLCEECSNANVAAPQAIFLTSALGGLLGWFVILLIGYTITDVAGVIGSDLDQPMGSYLLQSLGQKAGLWIFSLIIVCSFFTGQGIMVACSRVTYAYSRDDALPGSRFWSRINSWSRTPVNAGTLRETFSKR